MPLKEKPEERWFSHLYLYSYWYFYFLQALLKLDIYIQIKHQGNPVWFVFYELFFFFFGIVSMGYKLNIFKSSSIGPACINQAQLQLFNWGTSCMFSAWFLLDICSLVLSKTLSNYQKMTCHLARISNITSLKISEK